MSEQMQEQVMKNKFGKFCFETIFRKKRVEFNLVDSRYNNLQVGEKWLFEPKERVIAKQKKWVFVFVSACFDIF